MGKLIALLLTFTLASCASNRTGEGQSPIISNLKKIPKRQHFKGASVQALTPIENKKTDFFMALLEIPSGGRVPLHKDPCSEAVFFLSGQGLMSVNGTDHPVKAGSFVYMPAGAEVKFKAYTKTKIVQVFSNRLPESKYLSWPLPNKP